MIKTIFKNNIHRCCLVASVSISCNKSIQDMACKDKPNCEPCANVWGGPDSSFNPYILHKYSADAHLLVKNVNENIHNVTVGNKRYGCTTAILDDESSRELLSKITISTDSLELGGTFFAILSIMAGAQSAIAVDLSENEIDWAKKLMQEFSSEIREEIDKKLTLICGDANAEMTKLISFKKSFDIIYSRHLIHFLSAKQLDEFMQKSASLLKKDGTLSITTNYSPKSTNKNEFLINFDFYAALPQLNMVSSIWTPFYYKEAESCMLNRSVELEKAINKSEIASFIMNAKYSDTKIFISNDYIRYIIGQITDKVKGIEKTQNTIVEGFFITSKGVSKFVAPENIKKIAEINGLELPYLYCDFTNSNPGLKKFKSIEETIKTSKSDPEYFGVVVYNFTKSDNSEKTKNLVKI